MGNISNRHHYLPEFYIKGFTNENKLLYVYDKKKDIIYKRPMAPAGVFYELQENTIKLQGIETSELEDVYFRELDNKLSKVVKKFRSKITAKELFIETNNIELSFFFISIFWRIPATRDLIFDLVQNANLSFTLRSDSPLLNALENKQYKTDPSFLKLSKIALAFETLAKLNYDSDEIIYHKINDLRPNALLLGDYPMIYEKVPNSFNDLYYSNHLYPVSSTRIISLTRKELKPMDVDTLIPINLTIIHQSLNYITSPSFEFLDLMIQYYKALSQSGELNETMSTTFDYK